MKYASSEAALAIFLFVAAAVCEICGGWLVWKWRREGGIWVYLILGAIVLVAFGIIPTFQRQDFGRTYAAYGGFFILLSLFWGWAVDGNKPDMWDWVGAAVAIAGACIIMFVPRTY
ncbi:hypothetical protein KP509_25G048300 [Ceratopteris richardii]|uniref:Uncharacterized protein n=1 Tax=Ceratopteris richardii TaxID=49495 RepID=A0A8T2RRF2_CERRI|nr:hypothetical protein KP509_25G048300 [Ceratopteris richardii]